MYFFRSLLKLCLFSLIKHRHCVPMHCATEIKKKTFSKHLAALIDFFVFVGKLSLRYWFIVLSFGNIINNHDDVLSDACTAKQRYTIYPRFYCTARYSGYQVCFYQTESSKYSSGMHFLYVFAREYFERQAGCDTTIEFFKQSDMDESLYVALKFETRVIAKDIKNRYEINYLHEMFTQLIIMAVPQIWRHGSFGWSDWDDMVQRSP